MCAISTCWPCLCAFQRTFLHFKTYMRMQPNPNADKVHDSQGQGDNGQNCKQRLPVQNTTQLTLKCVERTAQHKCVW
jgi:hypothetical protein